MVRGDFMHFDHELLSDTVLHFETRRCFAYEGIKRMGAIDGYDCGIFARVAGWFDGLGVSYEVAPPLQGCMMHSDGTCFRDFTFSFR